MQKIQDSVGESRETGRDGLGRDFLGEEFEDPRLHSMAHS